MHWNSEFDPYKVIYELRDKVNIVMEKLQLPKFMPTEFDFLDEWLMIITPIRTSLDKLQGDKSQEAYFGAVLPTPNVVKHRLDSSVTEHYSALLNALIVGFNNRSGGFLKFDDILTNSKKQSVVLAALSHPYFKLRWLTDRGDKKIAEELFLAECQKLNAGASDFRPHIVL